ncbi:hypothetical protein [Arenimonas terrae]|uniref:Uncharacterized protein n=1 Tax=Arenimonas terrae TaxID=2546226 RepID=A0A5C4RXX4_9GAMM|nr:hypothetical protein [Arenimonas terrae]TNJ35789.1 hypothetical protein E1B00_08605 [Arenimonas terrae]
MIRPFASLVLIATLASCTSIKVQSVSISEEDGFRATTADTARIGWYNHSPDMAGIRVVALINAGEFIPKESIWVREADDTLTLCFSVAARSDQQAGQRTVVIRTRVKGIPRGDRRMIEASRGCGKTA